MVHTQLSLIHGYDALIGQRVGHVEIRVVRERGRLRARSAIIGANATVGAQQDVGQRIGFPLEAQISVPTIVACEVLRMTVRERAVVLAIEVLAGVFIGVVTIAVIPANAGVDLQAASLITTDETSTSAARSNSTTGIWASCSCRR